MIPRETPTTRATVESGARAAALALGRMLRRPGMPGEVDEPDRELLAERLGDRAVAIWFMVTGTTPARFAALIPEADALALARHLVTTGDDVIGPRESAALAELGNIAASAFLNGVASLVQGSCVPSVPEFVAATTDEVLRIALGDSSIDTPAQTWSARVDVDQRAVWLVWIA